MPPFDYGTGYRNPYVASMSALLQQPGQIEAQRAMAVAQAQGNAATASGNAWAGAANQIGQTVAQIPQQMQQQKLDALKMADIKGQIAERNAKAAEMARAQAAQAAGEQAIKASVDPTTGKVDYEKAASLWEQAGFPTQANAYRESVQKTRQTAQSLDEGQQKIEAGKRQVQQGYVDHLAELGAAGLERLKTDDPMHARDYAMGLVANAASHGLVSPDDAKQMLMQTAQASPDQLAGIYQKLVDGSATVKERMVADAVKQSEIAKNNAQAAKDANPPKGPNSQEANFRLDGKDVKGDYLPGQNGQPGRYFYNGQDVTAKAQVIPLAAQANNAQNKSDAENIADAIEQGKQPPTVNGLFRMAGPVRAELAKRGYDFTTANLDWEATKKHLATLNGAQQTRLRQSISTASDSLDVIQSLADRWDAGRFPILNKANLVLAKNGAYGKDAASIATQLEGQITDVTSELGNVYMGGNSPTDHALQLAGKNLSADWDRKVLTDMIELARKNLQIRGNSMRNAGAVTASSQTAQPPTAPVSSSTVRKYNPATGKLE